MQKILFLILVLSFSLQIKAQSNGFELIKGMELMDLIHQNLELHYVDEPKPGKLCKVAIDAMLKELDPYTVYYHESNMEDYRMMTTGQYGGIGAMIRIPSALKLSAISSSRFLIFDMRTPGAGTISYKVTVGPTVALILAMSIL